MLQYVLPTLLLALGLMVWFLIQVASGRAPNDHGDGHEGSCASCSQTGTCGTAFAPESQRTCTTGTPADGEGPADFSRFDAVPDLTSLARTSGLGADDRDDG